MKFFFKTLFVFLFVIKFNSFSINFGNIDPKLAYDLVQKNSNVVIIDVRNGSEYDEESIPMAILIQQEKLANNFDFYNKTVLKGKTIIVHCRAGVRGGETLEKISKLTDSKVYNLKGGIIEWKKEGLPTLKAGISIMRQTQIAIGIMLISFGLLAFFKNKKFILAIIFIGFGLLSAGLTGNCGLAYLIKQLPWNQ